MQPWRCSALELRKGCVFLNCHVGGLSICRCICMIIIIIVMIIMMTMTMTMMMMMMRSWWWDHDDDCKCGATSGLDVNCKSSCSYVLIVFNIIQSSFDNSKFKTHANFIGRLGPSSLSAFRQAKRHMPFCVSDGYFTMGWFRKPDDDPWISWLLQVAASFSKAFGDWNEEKSRQGRNGLNF